MMDETGVNLVICCRYNNSKRQVKTKNLVTWYNLHYIYINIYIYCSSAIDFPVRNYDNILF